MRVTIEIDDDDAAALDMFAVIRGLEVDDELPCEVDETCTVCMAGEALRRLHQIGAATLQVDENGEEVYSLVEGMSEDEIETRTAAVARHENRVAAAIRELLRLGREEAGGETSAVLRSR